MEPAAWRRAQRPKRPLRFLGAFASLGAAAGLVVARWTGSTGAAERRELAREARGIGERDGIERERAKALHVLDVEPERVGRDLAAAQLANARADDAIATLEKLAALGAHSPVEKSAEFGALRGQKEFSAIVKKLAANLYPKGDGEIAFSLPSMTGVIEGIAWRETTGEFFFGDAHNRCVWVRAGATKDDKRGDRVVRRFTPEGEDLWGVLGLAVDEVNGVLWAATSAVPAMSGFAQPMDGTAGLAEIDLATGAVRRVIPVARRPGDQQSHVLGDLALGPDGSVYLPDSGGPTVWRLAPGANALDVDRHVFSGKKSRVGSHRSLPWRLCWYSWCWPPSTKAGATRWR